MIHHKYCFPLFIFLTVFLAACSSDIIPLGEREDHVQTEPSLSVATPTLSFEAVGGSQDITVTCNTDWTASSDTPSWCTVAKGDGKVTVTATENTSEEQRTAIVTITASTEKREVTVTQAGKTQQETPNETRTFTVTGNGKTVSFNMVLVEAGTFQMGSNDSDSRANSEKPAHSVTLTNDYWMGETEVTQALWYAVMGQQPTSDGDQWNSTWGLGDNRPAYYISYNDCLQFIKALNKLLSSQLGSNERFCIPTEAEWEFAARGGNKSKGYQYFGSNDVESVAWYNKNSYDIGEFSHDVATKQANELGLYDMGGNVWEWCRDWFGSYSSGAQTDPTGPTTGSKRVRKGGDWYFDAWYCRPAARGACEPEIRDYENGLRLALQEGSNSPDDEAPNEARTFTFTGNGKTVTFTMRQVEAGTFQMGSDNFKSNSDEKPVHTVTLTNDYWMGETEVTQALWYAIMGQKPTSDDQQWRSAYGLSDNHPAYYISYEDCLAFIKGLNTKLASQLGSSECFRLPTEAEWEFAARGGNISKGYVYAGSNTIDDVAWYKDNSYSKGDSSPDYGTHVVATKLANELGFYDMSGNVCEWCYNWYDSYSNDTQTDPIGPTTGVNRVHRGGGWSYEDSFGRTTCRSRYNPTYRYSYMGMRLALGKAIPSSIDVNPYDDNENWD